MRVARHADSRHEHVSVSVVMAGTGGGQVSWVQLTRVVIGTHTRGHTKPC